MGDDHLVRAPYVTGAIAGFLTVLSFTVLHQILISNIWFSFVAMALAGALCGATLAWTYDLLFETASPRSWWGFILLHTGLLLLGVASVLAFEPAVPMAALIAANEPPTELIGRAIPLTGAFIVVAALVPTFLWGRSLRKLASNLVTSAVLIVLLGLNVSVLGLVDMSVESRFVVVEFLALLVVIMLIYGTIFVLLRGLDPTVGYVPRAAQDAGDG